MIAVMENNRKLSEPEQREITRLCIWTGQLLMQHGAESALVEAVSVRLGAALGLENVQVAITANALSLTTLCGGHCITTVRRTVDHGINMHVVTEVQRTMILAETKRIDRAETRQRLEAIRPFHYPKAVVAVMIGLSCASFARLMGADGPSCALVFAASGIAMVVRQVLTRWHFNPLVSFFVTAFVATSIAGLGVRHAVSQHPDMVMAASVLLLIPGFPLINAVSDMVKGYVNTGVARWTFAMLLILASSMGILLAFTLWKVKGWT
jgi:uncharacterized membrane protein YjjP (DUF1212 family)